MYQPFLKNFPWRPVWRHNPTPKTEFMSQKYLFSQGFPACLCTVLFRRLTCLSRSLQMSDHCFGDGFPKRPAVQHHHPAVLQPRRAGDHVCVPSHLQHLPDGGRHRFGRRWEFNEQKWMLACHTLDSVVQIYPLKRWCHVNRIILLTVLIESDSPIRVVNIRYVCLILASCSGQIRLLYC